MGIPTKKDFPIFKHAGSARRPFIYLDSASTSQKPRAVIAAETRWYERQNANINRGPYRLAEAATESFNAVREKVARFIKAPSNKNIIFTKGTTESINLVAQAWGRHNLKAGDVILLTEMEHHSNIVPWQRLAQEKKLTLRYWPMTKNGELTSTDQAKIFQRVKLLAITHISNVLGTINPLDRIIKTAHRQSAAVLVDAAQSAPHLPLNVTKLKPDFLAFSGHKMLGPTGIGVLYVDPTRYSQMPPWQSGGDMVVNVGWKTSNYKPAPQRFEAGTQPLAQVAGLGAAIDYLNAIGMKIVWRHNQQLARYAYQQLSKLPGVKLYGPKQARGTLVSFTVNGIHPHDLATWLDHYHIAIRAGHHCAQPLHQRLGVTATARLSFSVYNRQRDIDYCITALKTIINQWQRSTQK